MVSFKKKLVGSTLLAMLGVSVFSQHHKVVQAVEEVNKYDALREAQGLNAYENGMSAGMIFKIAQRDVENLKAAFKEFLPHYIEFDYEKPY